MPSEFTNPAYIPSHAGSGGDVRVITVANAAARLALIQVNALGRIVEQADDSSVWCLVPGGLAAQTAGWKKVGWSTRGTLAAQNADAVAITGGSLSGITLAQVNFTDAAAARTALGLGQVNDTADAEKPVSTAQAAADTAVLDSAAADATAKVLGALDGLGNLNLQPGDLINSYPPTNATNGGSINLRGGDSLLSVVAGEPAAVGGYGGTIQLQGGHAQFPDGDPGPSYGGGNGGLIEMMGYSPNNSYYNGGSGGQIIANGAINGNGGYVFLSGGDWNSGGYLSARGGADGYNTSFASDGGAIRADGGAGPFSPGGVLNVSGGNWFGSAGGSISAAGGDGLGCGGGYLNLNGGAGETSHGGQILLNGGNGTSCTGGSVQLRGGSGDGAYGGAFLSNGSGTSPHHGGTVDVSAGLSPFSSGYGDHGGQLILRGCPIDIVGGYGVPNYEPSRGSFFLQADAGNDEVAAYYRTGTSWVKLASQTATETFSNKTLVSPKDAVVFIGNTGTAKTIALTAGHFQTATLTGNCVFTMPAQAVGASFQLLLKTGTGGFTAAFTGVKWPGGAAPTITATAGRMDILRFTSDGTNWYGSITQNYTP